MNLLIKITLLSLITFSIACIFFTKDVACKIKLNLTVLNIGSEDYVIELKNGSKINEHSIKIDNPKFILRKEDTVNTIIDYEWIGNEKCCTGGSTWKLYDLTIAEVIRNGAVIKRIEFAPYDTTIRPGIYLNENQWNYTYDTLFIY